jgi:hypothetical protein
MRVSLADDDLPQQVYRRVATFPALAQHLHSTIPGLPPCPNVAAVDAGGTDRLRGELQNWMRQVATLLTAVRARSKREVVLYAALFCLRSEDCVIVSLAVTLYDYHAMLLTTSSCAHPPFAHGPAAQLVSVAAVPQTPVMRNFLCAEANLPPPGLDITWYRDSDEGEFNGKSHQ